MSDSLSKPKRPTFHGSVVRQLAKILKETDLTEIEYEVEGSRIRVARHVNQTSLVNAPQMTPMVAAPTSNPERVPSSESPTQDVPKAPPQQDPNNHPGAVKSPMVGTAYLAPSPDDPTFIQVGSDVKEGDTLLIVEAMKVMNPIRAPKGGKVVEVLVSNAEPIEYDQPLVIIE